MPYVSRADLADYVEQHIQTYHDNRYAALQSLNFTQVLSRKNPYLFKAKNINIASDLVKALLDAHLSSQEETLFGTFLEGIAIFVCSKTYGGFKSRRVGIDLEFEHNSNYYIVSIKSGPNWANSDQLTKMKLNFAANSADLVIEDATRTIVPVNGCCYGRDAKPSKGTYLKLCGQPFWELLSGDADMYLDMIEPLGHRAKEKNDEFALRYAAVLNRDTVKFSTVFCDELGNIQWDKIVRLVSGTNRA